MANKYTAQKIDMDEAIRLYEKGHVRLCKSCHSKFDGGITNIIGKSL